MLKKINLRGKTALVTGAGKGLGRACAIALAEAGANVIIISRTKKDLDKVNKIIKKTKGSSKSYVCDVTNINSFKTILKKINKLDILVNNAGNNRPEHFTKVKRENMEYLTNLNMKAVFNIAQLCSLKMVELKNRNKIGGSIIHMSSQLGKVGCEGRNVYNMNKFGVEGLARGMACELAKYNITVNTVSPGPILTELQLRNNSQNKTYQKKYMTQNPMRRFGSPEEVANAISFFVSDQASFITGQTLYVCGGMSVGHAPI